MSATILTQFLIALEEWAQKESLVEGVIVVGSYARGTNKADSDLDLCIITASKAKMLKTQAFAEYFGIIVKKQIESYGACTSVRVWYENGLEVEFGIVEPAWIALPLDSGTARVLSDGYKIIVDKQQYFKNLAL